MQYPSWKLQRAACSIFRPGSASARPTLLYEGEHSLEFNGEEVRFLHLPGGHTDTDVVVHFTGSNVLHLGDLYNAGVHSFPNIDIGAGGTVAGLIATLESLLEWVPADALIIPGHYELSDRDGLRACHDMVVATARYVREQMRMGASVSQLLAVISDPVGGKTSRWL